MSALCDLFLPFADGDLHEDAAAEYRAHLPGCDDCRAALQGYALLEAHQLCRLERGNRRVLAAASFAMAVLVLVVFAGVLRG